MCVCMVLFLCFHGQILFAQQLVLFPFRCTKFGWKILLMLYNWYIWRKLYYTLFFCL
jgi:hypothetical protein